MKYMGFKSKLAKHILPIILSKRLPEQYYVEPFCGGCNLIDKVLGNRIANVVHFYLIEMYKAIQSGWVPPKEVSKEDYLNAKKGNITCEFKNALIGYIGFNATFGSKYFNGYANEQPNRNYTQESYRNIIKQIPQLLEIEFNCGSYDEFYIPKNSLIYCDPPYKNTTKYVTDTFDYNKFYEWCRTMKNIGHTIYISEYGMPDDFTCVYEKNITSSLSQKNKISTEKLFTLN